MKANVVPNSKNLSSIHHIFILIFILFFLSSCLRSKMWDATQEGNLSEVKDLIELEENINYLPDLLGFAVRKNQIEIVRHVLQLGTDINSRSGVGRLGSMTPLLWAVHYNLMDMVQFLVVNGADIYELDARGRNSLQLALDLNHENIAIFLETGESSNLGSFQVVQPLESGDDTTNVQKELLAVFPILVSGRFTQEEKNNIFEDLQKSLSTNYRMLSHNRFKERPSAYKVTVDLSRNQLGITFSINVEKQGEKQNNAGFCTSCEIPELSERLNSVVAELLNEY